MVHSIALQGMVRNFYSSFDSFLKVLWLLHSFWWNSIFPVFFSTFCFCIFFLTCEKHSQNELATLPAFLLFPVHISTRLDR